MSEKHSCQTILFTCLDWRLHPKTENYFQKQCQSFDLCVTAGSIKGFLEKPSQKYLLEQIKTSQKLHNSKNIILTLHRDCGAFGGSRRFKNSKEEFLHHQKILNEAEKIISKKFPKSKIIKYFIELRKFDENKWIVSFKKVAN